MAFPTVAIFLEFIALFNDRADADLLQDPDEDYYTPISIQVTAVNRCLVFATEPWEVEINGKTYAGHTRIRAASGNWIVKEPYERVQKRVKDACRRQAMAQRMLLMT